MNVHLHICPHIIHSANAYKCLPYAILGDRCTAGTKAEKNVFSQSLHVYPSMNTHIYPCRSMNARKAWTRTFIHAAPCMHAKREHAHLSMPLHACTQSVSTRIYPCRSMHARKAWARAFIHAAPCMHAKREHAHLSMPLHACTQRCICMCVYMHIRKSGSTSFIWIMLKLSMVHHDLKILIFKMKQMK